jgi:hypothetical protein
MASKNISSWIALGVTMLVFAIGVFSVRGAALPVDKALGHMTVVAAFWCLGLTLGLATRNPAARPQFWIAAVLSFLGLLLLVLAAIA